MCPVSVTMCLIRLETASCCLFNMRAWAEPQCWQRLLRHDFTRYTHQPCQEDARLRGCCLIGNFDKYIDRLGRTPQFLSPGPCGLSSEILRSYFIWVFGGEIKCIFPSACDTAPAPLSLSPGIGMVRSEVWRIDGRWSGDCPGASPAYQLSTQLCCSYLDCTIRRASTCDTIIILRLILIVILWTAGTGVLR